MKKIKKVALLRVDMTKDFRDKDYEIDEGVYKKPGLPVPHADTIISAIRELSNVARKYDIFIADVLDKHEKDDPEFADWGRHCIKYFSGSNVIDELVVEGVRTYGKQSHSGFSNQFLAIDLRDAGVGTVIIVGLVGNICVKATGEGAKEASFNVIFVKDATCFLPEVENDPQLKEAELEALAKIGQVVATDEAIELIKKSR